MAGVTTRLGLNEQFMREQRCPPQHFRTSLEQPHSLAQVWMSCTVHRVLRAKKGKNKSHQWCRSSGYSKRYHPWIGRCCITEIKNEKLLQSSENNTLKNTFNCSYPNTPRHIFLDCLKTVTNYKSKTKKILAVTKILMGESTTHYNK